MFSTATEKEKEVTAMQEIFPLPKAVWWKSMATMWNFHHSCMTVQVQVLWWWRSSYQSLYHIHQRKSSEVLQRLQHWNVATLHIESYKNKSPEERSKEEKRNWKEKNSEGDTKENAANQEKEAHQK